MFHFCLHACTHTLELLLWLGKEQKVFSPWPQSLLHIVRDWGQSLFSGGCHVHRLYVNGIYRHPRESVGDWAGGGLSPWLISTLSRLPDGPFGSSVAQKDSGPIRAKNKKEKTVDTMVVLIKVWLFNWKKKHFYLFNK